MDEKLREILSEHEDEGGFEKEVLARETQEDDWIGQGTTLPRRPQGQVNLPPLRLEPLYGDCTKWPEILAGFKTLIHDGLQKDGVFKDESAAGNPFRYRRIINPTQPLPRGVASTKEQVRTSWPASEGQHRNEIQRQLSSSN